MNTLNAEKRSLSIKAKKLRREGYVTGNIFGTAIETSIPIKMEKSAAERVLKECGKGGQIVVNVDGQAYNTLIKEIAFNSLKRQIDEIDFQALVAGEKIHAVAEVILLNYDKSSAGVVQQQLHEISYRAIPSALVDKIKIDMTNMKMGNSIKVKDLDIANNKDIELLTDLDATVVAISEVHSAAAETAATDEENTAE